MNGLPANSLPLSSEDPLAALRDITVPEAVSWWPLAPGWWLLIGLLMASLAYAGWRLWQLYLARRYLREARLLMAAIGQQLQAGRAAPVLLAEIIELLRRVALQRGDLGHATGLSATEFLTALNRAHPAKTALPVAPALLAAALYAPQPASSEPLTEYTRALYSAAQQWIAALPRSTATSQQ